MIRSNVTGRKDTAAGGTLAPSGALQFQPRPVSVEAAGSYILNPWGPPVSLRDLRDLEKGSQFSKGSGLSMIAHKPHLQQGDQTQPS